MKESKTVSDRNSILQYVYHGMYKNVLLGYVLRDTSPIIGQRKWLCRGNMQTWTEAINLTDKKKLRNATN